MPGSLFLWRLPDVAQLTRRVTFRQRALDANGDRLGPETDVVTRDARVQPLRGGEAVQSQRLAGQQPVVIYVRRDNLTKTIDNSFQAIDARDPAIIWDVASVIVSEDLTWIEVLAVQLLGVSWATPAAPPTNTDPPTITGSLVEGNILTGHVGIFAGVNAYTYAWTKDGTPIGGADAITYQTVHGDVGAAIRFEPTGHGAVAPPAPAASAPVTITTAPSGVPAHNADELYTALSTAAGGEVFLLDAATDYLDVVFPPGKDFTSNPVTIQCQAGTVFNSIFIGNFKGATINGGNIYGAYQGVHAGLMIQNGSAHITAHGLTFNTGDPDGTQHGNGVQIRDSSFVTINGQTDSAKLDVSGRGQGVALIDSSSVTLNGLTFKNIEVDEIDISGVATATVNACLGWDKWPQVGDHPDFIQAFGTNSNLTIQNNGWEQKGGGGEFGGASQGITLEGTHTGTVLNGNWILGGLTNTFQISGGSNAQVENNFAQGFLIYGSRFIARDGTVNCMVTNNTAASVQNVGTNPGFSEVGTTHISDVAAGTHTDVDVWLAAHTSARARPA